MEQTLTVKDLQKLINKKYESNIHLFVLDRMFKGRMRACICDADNNIGFYMTDRSAPKSTDVTIYDTEGNELVHITETVVKADEKEKQKLFPCCFHIELYKKYAGKINIDLLHLNVEVDGIDKNWDIRHSDKYSLGYSYKYTVFHNGREAAHFRSKLLHQRPIYIMDHSPDTNQLFLITLFVIHSIFTNKRQIKEVKKIDRLARNKGLLGL